MKIRKAVITAAGKEHRTLPLQSLIDRDGKEKTALRIILEEVVRAGVEDICIVVTPGDQSSYFDAAGDLAKRLHFVEQRESKGYGNAVYSALEFVEKEPFLHMVGDHIYCSAADKSCAQQVIEIASAEDCAISAVRSLRENWLPYYGAIGGKLVHARRGLYVVDKVIEKPTPTEGEQELIVPGLRAGHYLCFFGMHVLTHSVMEILAGGVHVSEALDVIAGKERYLAFEVNGQCYDIGVKYGLLKAQMALALQGNDRDEVLTMLIELLASRT